MSFRPLNIAEVDCWTGGPGDVTLREIPCLALDVALRGLVVAAQLSSTNWRHRDGRCSLVLNGPDAAAAGSPAVSEHALVAVASVGSPVRDNDRARSQTAKSIRAWRPRWLPGRQSWRRGSR